LLLPPQLVAVQHAGHSALDACTDDEVSLSFAPGLPAQSIWALAGVPDGLRVSLRITLGETLRQTLQTHNSGTEPFELTKALHGYYAVSHAQRIAIDGIQGLTYTDRVRELANDVQRAPFLLDQACDRPYQHKTETPVSRDTLLNQLHCPARISFHELAYAHFDFKTTRPTLLVSRRWLQIAPKSAAIAGDGLNQQVDQYAQQQHRQSQIQHNPARRQPSRARFLNSVAHHGVDSGTSKKALKKRLQRQFFHGLWILVTQRLKP